MEIISVSFIFFVFISFIICLLLQGKSKTIWLMIISVFFYFLWDVRFVLVLTLMILVNYWFLRIIQSGENKRFFITAQLILNIGVFIMVKFFSSHYMNFTNHEEGFLFTKIILPVGFSYYMLQMISFQLDVSNKKITVPNLIDFSLFFFYFPKLLSGPIEKPRLFLPKLAEIKKVDFQLFLTGTNFIFLGLVRKLFIANILFYVLPDWLHEINTISWSHVIGFVLYVYNDFAGYTLIIRGVSCYFGIELSSNFLQPLLSRNYSEFWNRWHISLSTWLRENIYFPLSRKLNRMQNIPMGKTITYIAPPLLTMMASGFWHGASLALLLWGVIFGLLMILERFVFEKWPSVRAFTAKGFGAWISRFIILISFSMAMVPLCLNITKPTLKVWQNLFSETGFQMNDAVIPVLLLGLFSYGLDYASEKSGKEIWWENLHVIPRSAIVAFGILLIIISIILIYFYPSSVFIYQGF